MLLQRNSENVLVLLPMLSIYRLFFPVLYSIGSSNVNEPTYYEIEKNKFLTLIEYYVGLEKFHAVMFLFCAWLIFFLLHRCICFFFNLQIFSLVLIAKSIPFGSC